jgi:hypothetical protein
MSAGVPAGSPIAGLRASTILFAIIALVGIVIAAVVALSLSGDTDQQAPIAAIIALATPILIGLLALLTKADQIHQLVNSKSVAQEAKIDQLIAANRALGGTETGQGA